MKCDSGTWKDIHELIFDLIRYLMCSFEGNIFLTKDDMTLDKYIITGHTSLEEVISFERWMVLKKGFDFLYFFLWKWSIEKHWYAAPNNFWATHEYPESYDDSEYCIDPPQWREKYIQTESTQNSHIHKEIRSIVKHIWSDDEWVMWAKNYFEIPDNEPCTNTRDNHGKYDRYIDFGSVMIEEWLYTTHEKKYPRW